ncbi:MAG: peptidylprolyl isomerase [bacterium]
MRPLFAALVAFVPLALSGGEAPGEESQKDALAPGTYARLTTDEGEILIRLLSNDAPKTVRNFVELAKGQRPWKAPDGRWVAKPFYDGLVFFRIERDELIQAGCPLGDGTAGPGYRLDPERPEKLRFDKPGVVAMEKADAEAHGSQFFIAVDALTLDAEDHTIFGQVVEGVAVARHISRRPARRRAGRHLATEPVVIRSVAIEEVAVPTEPPEDEPQGAQQAPASD